MAVIPQHQETAVMLIHLDPILDQLRPCFSRQAAFDWFVVIILGLLIRCDHLGVTSLVRWLFLRPHCYDLILHFCRATSWQLDALLAQWAQVAVAHSPTPSRVKMAASSNGDGKNALAAWDSWCSVKM